MRSDKTNIVVFDIDGTLTDSVTVHQAALEAALRSFEFPALRTDWGGYKHHSDSAILIEAWEEAGLDGNPDLVQFEAEYAWRYDDMVRNSPFSEIPSAGSFVKNLRLAGWTVIFATGSLRYGALHKLSVLGIDGKKEILVSASEFQTREAIVGKAVALACEAARQSTVGRVVSIGDGIWDLKTARNFGYEFVGIGSMEKAAALEELGAIVYRDIT